MCSDGCMLGLIIFYVFMAGLCAWEGRTWNVIYWITLAGCNTAVFKMMYKA